MHLHYTQPTIPKPAPMIYCNSYAHFANLQANECIYLLKDKSAIQIYKKAGKFQQRQWIQQVLSGEPFRQTRLMCYTLVTTVRWQWSLKEKSYTNSKYRHKKSLSYTWDGNKYKK